MSMIDAYSVGLSGEVHEGSQKIFSPEDRMYSCFAIIEREDDGYVAWIENLPGVVSDGDSIDEAIDNIKEALSATLSEYLDSTGDIPWSSSKNPQSEYALKRLVTVHA